MNRRSLLKSLAAVTAGLTALATRPPVEAAAAEVHGLVFNVGDQFFHPEHEEWVTVTGLNHATTIDLGQRWDRETQTVSTSQTFGFTIEVPTSDFWWVKPGMGIPITDVETGERTYHEVLAIQQS